MTPAPKSSIETIDAEVAQLLDDALGPLELGDEAGLGDLQHEALGGQVVVVELLADEVREPTSRGVVGEMFTADREVAPGEPPGRTLRDGLLEHPLASAAT